MSLFSLARGPGGGGKSEWVFVVGVLGRALCDALPPDDVLLLLLGMLCWHMVAFQDPGEIPTLNPSVLGAHTVPVPSHAFPAQLRLRCATWLMPPCIQDGKGAKKCCSGSILCSENSIGS